MLNYAGTRDAAHAAHGEKSMTIDRMRTAFLIGVAVLGGVLWLFLLVYILGVRAGRFA